PNLHWFYRANTRLHLDVAAIESLSMESSSEAPPATADPAAPIICRVTRWYFRRMGMLAGLFLVFGLVFLYDGLWGYPKSVEIANKEKWFTEEYLASYEAAKKGGRLEEWAESARAQGLPTGGDGE